MIIDACMTSILAATMFCTRCGQEYCGDCFHKIKHESTKLHEVKTAPKVLRCFRTDKLHNDQQFHPLSRFAQGELEAAIREMEGLLEQSPAEVFLPDLEVLKPLEEELRLLNQATEFAYARLELDSYPAPPVPVPSSSLGADTSSPACGVASYLSSTASTSGPATPPLLTPGDPDPEPIPPAPKLPTQAPPSVSSFSLNPIRASVHEHLEGRPKDPSGLESHRYSVYHHSELTDALFRTIWANGETLVITGLKDKLKCPWTPEWFIEQYGEQQCCITDCVTEKAHFSQVRHFFSRFGKYAERNGETLKLKVRLSGLRSELAEPGMVGLATARRL
jgi:lysine-specific demethylase 3